MCYSKEYLIYEASEKAVRELAILTAIEIFRKCNVADNVIKKKIMSKFNLM